MESQRKLPLKSELVVRITPVGNALTACLVGFWGACVIAVKLAPKSAFGNFLDTSEGVLAVIIGSIFFYAVSASSLENFGYPIMKRGSRDTQQIKSLNTDTGDA